MPQEVQKFTLKQVGAIISRIYRRSMLGSLDRLERFGSGDLLLEVLDNESKARKHSRRNRLDA